LKMTNNSNKANEPSKAAQTIALNVWGGGLTERPPGGY
jgi:hypothetical protein